MKRILVRWIFALTLVINVSHLFAQGGIAGFTSVSVSNGGEVSAGGTTTVRFGNISTTSGATLPIGSVTYRVTFPTFVTPTVPAANLAGTPFQSSVFTDGSGSVVSFTIFSAAVPPNTLYDIIINVTPVTTGGPSPVTGNATRNNASVTASASTPSTNILVSTILPVKLIDFAAVLKGCNTSELSWTTASETNSKHFVVERAIAGSSSFEPVATVAASNNSSTEKKYSYTDKNLNDGDYLYRLKLVDNDGKSEYSKILALAVSCNNRISVRPNPVTDRLLIYSPNTKGNVIITNVSGAQIFKSGSIPAAINTSLWPAGTYLIRIDNGRTQTFKIVKQ